MHETPYHSLHADTGGKLLFLYEYSKWTKDKNVTKNFQLSLINFVDHFSETPTNTFCAGTIGNIWLLEYFYKEDIIDNLLIEYKTIVNTSYYNWGKAFIENKNYDFLHGLLGLIYSGNYCNVIDDTMISDFINEMLKDLKSDGEIAYFTDWMSAKTEGLNHQEKVNFGLSHGLPSAIVILININSTDNKYKKVAIQLAEFIIKYKKKYFSNSLYNTILNDRKNDDENSRLAWCYGDIGIALSLWQLGKKLNLDKYKNESISIMKHSCLRKNLEENLIYDAGLCHGSSGIAEIFLIFYRETKLKEFKIAADYWIKQTLDMAKHKDGLAGYLTYLKYTPDKYIKDFGFLEGISGIGLSLLSSINDKSSNWNQCLLMSS
jgi:lantibiotic biosynthesis protein